MSSSSSNPVLLTYRTDGAWGTGKGSNLTKEEVDTNFYTLQRYVNFLHDNPVLPAQIESISVSGDQMTFFMTDGTTFGPFTLPAAALTFTGDFQVNHAYKTFDLLTANGSLYLVLQDHTSGVNFSSGLATSDGPIYRLVLPAQTIYDMGFFFPGIPGLGIDTSGAMFTFRFDRTVSFPQDLDGSVAGLGATTTADSVYAIYKNSTQIGTIQVNAGATVGYFTFSSPVQFDSGDRLRIIRPDTLDATARDLSVTLKGYKGTLEAASSS